jgi:hypothetical protein
VQADGPHAERRQQAGDAGGIRIVVGHGKRGEVKRAAAGQVLGQQVSRIGQRRRPEHLRAAQQHHLDGHGPTIPAPAAGRRETPSGAARTMGVDVEAHRRGGP